MRKTKNRRSLVYAISIGVHAAVGIAIAFIPKEKLREVVAIAFTDPPKPKPAVERPKTESRPQPQSPARRSRSAKPNAAAATPQTASADGPVFTNIGIALDSSALGGVAVRTAPEPVVKAPEPVAAPTVQRPKVLFAAAEKRCSEPLVKARPEKLVRADYTPSAKSAGVEGRVRLRLLLDELGQVKDAQVLEGLGHGLDEAALVAARQMRFRPATQCGKAVESPFVLSMRFVLDS